MYMYCRKHSYLAGNIFLNSLEIDFVLLNSADPDEMPHYVAFHLGLYCLPKYPVRCFWSSRLMFCLFVFRIVGWKTAG